MVDVANPFMYQSMYHSMMTCWAPDSHASSICILPSLGFQSLVTHTLRLLLVLLQAQLAASMWTAGGYYSMLPWSCIILESVSEDKLSSLRARGRGEMAKSAAMAKKGGPLNPTPQQQQEQRVGLPESFGSS